MIVQININMGVHGRSFSLAEFTKRWQIIDYLVRNNSDWEVERTGRKSHQVELSQVDTLVYEEVYVARIFGYVHVDDQFISSLADVLGQGCIAVYSEESGKGRLIGSRTDPWGEFDSNRFVFIEEVPA